jgi:hypothetical protein
MAVRGSGPGIFSGVRGSGPGVSGGGGSIHGVGPGIYGPQGIGRKGEGLRVRISRINGETPKGVLAKPLYLPATLRGFGWTEEFSHVEYDTVRSGQFSQPAMGPASARQLRDVDDTETLTMEWQPAWLVEHGVNPAHVASALRAAGRSRKAVELLAYIRRGDPALLRMDITIRSLKTELREGEPDTLYYVLRFKEWRNPSTRRKGAGHASRLPTTHTLTADDSLYSLSMHYYRTHEGWDDIARANRIKGFGKKTPLVKHRRFKVGSKIKIPIPSFPTVRGPGHVQPGSHGPRIR